jgi:hypothetical protein
MDLNADAWPQIVRRRRVRAVRGDMPAQIGNHVGGFGAQ